MRSLRLPEPSKGAAQPGPEAVLPVPEGPGAGQSMARRLEGDREAGFDRTTCVMRRPLSTAAHHCRGDSRGRDPDHVPVPGRSARQHGLPLGRGIVRGGRAVGGGWRGGGCTAAITGKEDARSTLL